MARRTPLYQRLIGAAYADLPDVTQSLHTVDGELIARGRGRVARNQSPFGNWLADRLGMPKAAQDIPVTVLFEEYDGGEKISRNYDGHILTTYQAEGSGQDAGLLKETFGPVTLYIHLDAHEDGIDFHLRRATFGVIPLPKMLRPRVTARERSLDGRHHYFVRVGLPAIGTLIEYEGLLELKNWKHDERQTERIDVV